MSILRTSIWRLLESPAAERITDVCKLVTFAFLCMNVIETLCAILELSDLVRKYGGATGRDVCAEIHDIWYSTVLSHVKLVCFILHTLFIIVRHVHGWVSEYVEEEEGKQAKEDQEKAVKDGNVAEDEEEESAQASPTGFFGGWTYLQVLIGLIVLDISLGFIDRPSTIVGGYEPRTWDLQRVNPYFRPLPADQDKVLREVIYMQRTLEEMCPMTLPNDNYEHYSSLIENLSARTDLSYRIWSASQIRPTIQRLHQRRISVLGNWHAAEPLFLEERIEAIHRHWRQLELAKDKPQPWAGHSDNIFLAPLSEQRYNYTRNGQYLLETVSDDENALDLTAEQNQKADDYYRRWRTDYDHKAYLFRRDPPVPTAWKTTMDYWLYNMVSIDSLIWDNNRYSERDEMSQLVPDRGSIKTGALKPIHDDYFDWDVRGYWPKPGETQESRNKEMEERNTFMDKQQAKKRAREVERAAFMKEIREQQTWARAQHIDL